MRTNYFLKKFSLPLWKNQSIHACFEGENEAFSQLWDKALRIREEKGKIGAR